MRYLGTRLDEMSPVANMSAPAFSFPVGYRATGEPVLESFEDGRQILLAGASGSGKSALARGLVLAACAAMGPALQVVIIDPKRVSFLGWERRAYVYTDEMEWVSLIDALTNEMQRRYAYMAQLGIRRWEATEDAPMLFLVVEEMAGVTCTSTALTRAQRDELTRRLVALSNQMRGCGMSALWITQTPEVAVIPAQIRNNAVSRIGCRLLSASAIDMLTGDRYEEARCDLLTLPGQFYAMTATTRGMYVRGRSRLLSADGETSALLAMQGDKRRLYCLDWDSPDFLG